MSSLAPSSRNPFRRGEDEHTLRIPEPLSGRFAERLGPYDVCFKLASGEVADVYLGIRSGPDGFQKVVTLKRLRPELALDEAASEELMREARVWARANHPFVRDVFDFLRLPTGACVLVMEFLVGEPVSVMFDAIAARKDDLPSNHVSASVRAMAGLCHAMHAVHEFTHDEESGFVHRDVTPRNLYVLHDGSVRVTDLGLVRRSTRAQLTKDDVSRGSVAYMAPECLETERADRRSDVWSLGVILWELVTGCRLFTATSLVDAFEQIVERPIPAPSSRQPMVSKALDEIVLRALSRDPTNRYANAQELAGALEAYLVSEQRLVVTSDVSAWLGELLPDSFPRLARMVELGRKMHQVLPSNRPGSEPPDEEDADAGAPRNELIAPHRLEGGRRDLARDEPKLARYERTSVRLIVRAALAVTTALLVLTFAVWFFLYR